MVAFDYTESDDMIPRVLEPDSTAPNGSRYDLLVEYEQVQEEAFLASSGNDGLYGLPGTTTQKSKGF